MKPGLGKASVMMTGKGKSAQGAEARSRLLQRFGRWGFLFFAVKGVLWLIGPMLLAWFSLEQ